MNVAELLGQLGIAPYGMRHAESVYDPFSAKGKGYFGMLPTDYGVATEISADSDMGQYPLLVPTLTSQEVDWLMQLSYLRLMIRELLARCLNTIGRAALSASQFVAPKMQVPLTSTIGASSHTEKPHKRSPRAIHSKTIRANQHLRHSNSKGGASPSRKPKTISES
jgi:hypothetical protein